MKFKNTNACLVLLAGFALNSAAVLADPVQGVVTKTAVNEKTYLQKHPVVKRTAIGAGVGAGAGALTGLVTGKGTLRGAAIGAGTGGSVGLIKSSKTLKQHPVASKVAEGTAIGLGLGLASSGGHSTAKRSLGAAGIGAALGLGAGLLEKEFK
ncbi:MAG: hypothetical protein K2X27_15780 [Candidatus Obscuribacterales bacterium]|nr:hypothetical protein [Candidatus Obscuribacterales bacterium]